MKKLISLVLVLILTLAICSIGFAEEGMKMMFVVTGSLGGGTNVDDVKAAIDEYIAANGGSVDTFECNMDTSLYQPVLQEAAETEEYDLIITGFSSMVESVCNVADMFPEQKFFIFDTAVDFSAGGYKNVISVQVQQNEGAFLAGALAALLTTSPDATMANDQKTVGFVGGTESTSITDFLVGYIEGVKYVDPSINVFYSFVGSHTDSALTQELALTQYQSGADVIFACTNSDLAVADVATTSNAYAICVDADEAANIAASNIETANHIPTSVVKDYKSMVAPILVAIGDGTANWGVHTYIPYSAKGVYLAENEFFDKLVPASVLELYRPIEQKLIDGEIEVSTAYGATTEEINEIKALADAN